MSGETSSDRTTECSQEKRSLTRISSKNCLELIRTFCHTLNLFIDNYSTRRPLVPLSTMELSRLIDLGWVDHTHPIDLATLLSTNLFNIRDEAGILLTAEVSLRSVTLFYLLQLLSQGVSCLPSGIQIEVQGASMEAIAQVEQNGGSITVAYYDPISIQVRTSSAIKTLTLSRLQRVPHLFFSALLLALLNDSSHYKFLVVCEERPALAGRREGDPGEKAAPCVTAGGVQFCGF